MPIQRNLVPEWRDEQSGSRYPFSDASTLISVDGWELPKDLFLDAIVYVIGASAPIYLKSILSESGLITFTIGDLADDFTASGSIDPYSSDVSIALTDTYGRPAGLLVCDEEKITRMRGWPLGIYNYDQEAEFVASVVIPLPENHLSGFLLPDGSIVTGDVWFFGDNGIVITKDEDEAIRFDLVGDPLFVRNLCGNRSTFVTPNFIKTINGILPDDNGNFAITVNNQLAGDTVLRIYPDLSANVLRVEFVGSKLESVV